MKPNASRMYQRMQDLMEESGCYRFITNSVMPQIYRNTIEPAFRADGYAMLRDIRLQVPAELMLRFIIRRGLLSLLILFLAVSLLFGMIHMVPGDPATVMLGPKATPELKAELSQRMGLDQPLPSSWAGFMPACSRGPGRGSVFRPQGDRHRVGATALHAGAGAGGDRRRQPARHSAGLFLGDSAQLPAGPADRRDVGGVHCHSVLRGGLVPVAVAGGEVALVPGHGRRRSRELADQAHHLVLPAIALGLGWVGYIARLVRASMLEVMEENHIRTARAFGLPERTIIVHYALRIAMLPTVTILGLGIGTMLSGALFAEIVFSRPGIGKLLYEAVLTRNYPIVMGSVLVTTGFFVLSTLVSDIINAMLDPRLRERQGA